MLRYRLTNIVKPTKLYLLYMYIIVYMHNVLFFRNVFHHHKNKFLITGIESKLCYCITLKKNYVGPETCLEGAPDLVKLAHQVDVKQGNQPHSEVDFQGLPRPAAHTARLGVSSIELRK